MSIRNSMFAMMLGDGRTVIGDTGGLIDVLRQLSADRVEEFRMGGLTEFKDDADSQRFVNIICNEALKIDRKG